VPLLIGWHCCWHDSSAQPPSARVRRRVNQVLTGNWPDAAPTRATGMRRALPRPHGRGAPMTLQIVCQAGQGTAVIELHGWLSGPEIAEFQKACASQPLPLRIDLKNLAGATAAGILALKEQRARGASLSGASPYIGLLLHGRGGDGP
jgi:hypothetical protein